MSKGLKSNDKLKRLQNSERARQCWLIWRQRKFMCSYCTFTASHGFTRLVGMHIKLTGPQLNHPCGCLCLPGAESIRKPGGNGRAGAMGRGPGTQPDRVKHVPVSVSGSHWHINVKANKNTEWTSKSAGVFIHGFLDCSAGHLKKKTP